MKRLLICVAMVLILADAAYCDDVDALLRYYVNRFTPETAELVISEKPDSSGKFNDVYMNLRGVMIEGLRLNRLAFRMRGVQFNEPSEWKQGKVECTEAMKVEAIGEVYEDDINKAIEAKTFGKDADHWHDMSLAITPQGLKGKGYYTAKVMRLPLDILLEIDSGLKIVKGKELWLNNPQVKVNKLDVPDYITKQALTKIQPLVDLKKIPLPMTLHKVDLKKGSATLSTRTLPKPLTQGLKYSYTK